MHTLNRLSSRHTHLGTDFLAAKLHDAKSYHRIAGYFRSSVLSLIGEQLSDIPDVKILCNSGLDHNDIQSAQYAQFLKEKWHDTHPITETFLQKGNYRKLTELLTKGNIEIRVVADSDIFVHGKAGVITQQDGSKVAFIGSTNETYKGLAESYEILWEDTSPEGVDWVDKEFDYLWHMGKPLADVILNEIARLAYREEKSLADVIEMPDNMIPASVFVESPLYLSGEQLQPWQRSFAATFMEHREKYGQARLLLADEVGVGKTLSLAASAVVSALLGDGPVLIICPSTLVYQWQVELQDRLGVPSAVWHSGRKAWMNSNGTVTLTNGDQDILRCPCQIAIVSNGLAIQPTVSGQYLLKGHYGTVILDEAHKARGKGGLDKESEDNKLLTFMIQLAKRAKNVLLGTATPMQTELYEIWDIFRILDSGVDFIFGKDSVWQQWKTIIPILQGEVSVVDDKMAWDLLRNPVPLISNSYIYQEIRQHFGLDKTKLCITKAFSDLPLDIKYSIQDITSNSKSGFFRQECPIVRHTVLRLRSDLEDQKLLIPVFVDVHPDPKLTPYGYPTISFSNKLGIPTNSFFERAYTSLTEFFTEYEGKDGIGLIKSTILQRMCSSFASGLATTRKLLANTPVDDDDMDNDSGKVSSVLYPMSPKARQCLENIIENLEAPAAIDPKFKMVTYFLQDYTPDNRTWLEHGCIIFSQYFDTVDWIAKKLSALLPTEPIAVYAGSDRSRIYLNGASETAKRDTIKAMVKTKEIRLLVATDAACEGLNLQTLGTMINIDLPWNPAKLEQRLGRIRRFGQRRVTVDMLNLVYTDTLDEKVYGKISRRMQDRYSVFGSLPDTIDETWIDSIEEDIEEGEKYWARRKEKDNPFHLAEHNKVNIDDNRWEQCTQVLAKQDILAKLSEPWK